MARNSVVSALPHTAVRREAGDELAFIRAELRRRVRQQQIRLRRYVVRAASERCRMQHRPQGRQRRRVLKACER
jgi:hypothetical protein